MPVASGRTKASSMGRLGRQVHIALLVGALLLLQFPQFVSGSVAMGTFGALYALSVLTWPRLRLIPGPFIALLGLMLSSAAWSEHPGTSLNATFALLVTIAAGFSVAMALELRLILKVIHRTTVLIGAVSLALGVVVPSFGLHSGPAYAGTLIGLYISKNSLALVVLFGALAMIFRERAELRRWSVLGSVAIYVPVFVWTESATTLAILAVGILLRVVYGWWIGSSSSTRAAVGALTLLPLVLVAWFGWSIYSGALAILGRDATLTGRTEIWQAALDAWSGRPWFGVGFGAFESDSVVSEIQAIRYGWVRNHAHSGYVQMLTELGVVGVVMLAFTLIFLLVAVINTIRRAPVLTNGWLLAAFVTFVSHNFAEQSMRLLPMFMLALIYGSCLRQRLKFDATNVLSSRTHRRRVRRFPAGRG